MKTLIQLKGIFGSIVIVVLLFACTNQSPEYLRYKKTIGKNVKLDMFENVTRENNLFGLDEIRKKYEFISIVYLQENCKSCYEKFITWHKEIEDLSNENQLLTIRSVYGSFGDLLYYWPEIYACVETHKKTLIN